MNLPELCLRRPVFAAVANLVIIAIGLVAATRLPVRELPDIDAAQISIRTDYRGAAPQVMDSQVTEIIEAAVAGRGGGRLHRKLVGTGRQRRARALRLDPRHRRRRQRHSRRRRPRDLAPARRGRRAAHLQERRRRRPDHAHRDHLDPLERGRDHRLRRPLSGRPPRHARRRRLGRASTAAAATRCASGSTPRRWPRASWR
jgi:hypothetical protein